MDRLSRLQEILACFLRPSFPSLEEEETDHGRVRTSPQFLGGVCFLFVLNFCFLM